MDRRTLLRGGAATAGALAMGTIASEVAASSQGQGSDDAFTAPDGAVPFIAEHQAGILRAPQRHATLVSFDLTARDRHELEDLMHVLTDRTRIAMAGGGPRQLGISAPSSDSGILGPTAPAGELTITLGLGASVFDDRYGLSSRRPTHLRRMDTFVNDDLDRARCDGDLLLQFAAPEPDTVLHALRDLARHTRGAMQVRWRIDGFSPPPRPSGAPRNPLGFKDGTANPDPRSAAQMDRLVWVNQSLAEPAWAVNGSYQVVRTVRTFVEFWDRVSTSEQERMFGRRKDTGAPLTGRIESDTPDYGNDPSGATTPLDSHIRLANPRTDDTDDNRILRRAYNYDAGTDTNGNLDMGLVFTCFQQDLDRQFVAIQKRLADEPLVDYVSPVGGGYFFAVPGVRSRHDFYASGLLA